MYKLDFHDLVQSDLDSLDDAVYLEVDSCFERMKEDPYSVSLPLYGNLYGYRKTYVADAKYRIITKIEEEDIKVVCIIAVGKRADKSVYIEAANRLKLS